MPTHLTPHKAVVVGAGPVGCLAALSLAKMGWRVEIYDARPDMRLPASKSAAAPRSINLAISSRGIAALQAVDPAAASRFLDAAIPMRGRMIHTLDGKQQSQAYDRAGRCINSIDRGLLNEGLLGDALAAPNIRAVFQHKLVAADFDRRTLLFRDTAGGRDVDVGFDFCVGADGSYSNVRRQLMRVVRMNFEQEYIPHEYMELRMPAERDADGNAEFPLDPNHLHIWPRHSFMLIALPNKDKSFTCTLFAPTTEFAQLHDPVTALAWFRTHFSDAVPHIGEEQLLEDLKKNPRSPLIAIKAKPYHYKDRVVILGDAAHSMVPFFGQGLNCGLEDVRVLDTILRSEGVDAFDVKRGTRETVDPRLEKALNVYSESRHDDLIAICDLAMNNYVEMRHSVATPQYLFLRALDNLFSLATARWQGIASSAGQELSHTAFPSRTPGGWIPLYTMVTFRPDISYATAKGKAARQGRVVAGLGWVGAVVVGIGGLRLLGIA